MALRPLGRAKKGEAYEASHEEGTASILLESVRFEG